MIVEGRGKEQTINYSIDGIHFMVGNEGVICYVRDNFGLNGGMMLGMDEIDEIILMLNRVKEKYAELKEDCDEDC